jgi:hypothetical protein
MLPEVCFEMKEAVRAYFAPSARFRVRAAAGLSAVLVSAFAARLPLMGSKHFFLTGYRLPWLFALRRLLVTGVESANRDHRI